MPQRRSMQRLTLSMNENGDSWANFNELDPSQAIDYMVEAVKTMYFNYLDVCHTYFPNNENLLPDIFIKGISNLFLIKLNEHEELNKPNNILDFEEGRAKYGHKDI